MTRSSLVIFLACCALYVAFMIWCSVHGLLPPGGRVRAG